MKLLARDILTDEDCARCPACGSMYLHQGAVRVWGRDKEDDDGALITVAGYEVTREPVKSEDMPGRRQSLEIDFICEECSARPILRIEQHKGVTHIYFNMWIEDDHPLANP